MTRISFSTPAPAWEYTKVKLKAEGASLRVTRQLKSIPSGTTIVIKSDEHGHYATAHNDNLQIDGTLQVDGSFILYDMGA